MTTKACKKGGRKHTPFTSESQTGAGGIAYAAKKGEVSPSELRGPAKAMYEGMTKTELKSHLEEAGGKNLPKKAKKSTKGSPVFTDQEIKQGYRRL